MNMCPNALTLMYVCFECCLYTVYISSAERVKTFASWAVSGCKSLALSFTMLHEESML